MTPAAHRSTAWGKLLSQPGTLLPSCHDSVAGPLVPPTPGPALDHWVGALEPAFQPSGCFQPSQDRVGLAARFFPSGNPAFTCRSYVSDARDKQRSTAMSELLAAIAVEVVSALLISLIVAAFRRLVSRPV